MYGIFPLQRAIFFFQSDSFRFFFFRNFGFNTSQHLFILANSDSFCIKRMGLSSKMVSLTGYVMFIGIIYLIAALYLVLFITEINPENGDFVSVKEVFK